MAVMNRIVAVTAVLVMCAFLATGCGKKAEEKQAKKMMENLLTQTTGNETKVDLQRGNVNIENKDMKVDITATSTWPADMFADVPQFTGGAIERVVKSDEGGKKNFNVHYKNVGGNSLKQYAEDLKATGWQANITEMGEKAALLNAQKDNLGLTFTYSAEKKDGMLAVFGAQ
jgi:hypothetical protein